MDNTGLHGLVRMIFFSYFHTGAITRDKNLVRQGGVPVYEEQ